MRLEEYRRGYMLLLTRYQPRGRREAELQELLINRLYTLNEASAYILARDLYEIIHHEDVSKEFKEMTERMLVDLAKALQATREHEA